MTKYNVDEIVINNTILRRLFENNNKEFEEFFINNFNKILDNSKSFDSILIAQLCNEKPNIRKVVFENLPDVLKKMTERAFFISCIRNSELVKKHCRDFFAEDLTGKGVNYNIIIDLLSEKSDLLNFEEILNLIYDFIENIILYSDKTENFLWVMQYIENHCENPYKYIEKIDSALARNIDNIINNMSKSYKASICDFSFFDRMKMFKEEIRKKGMEFFLNLSLNASFEEIKAISKELFGTFNEKAFAIMVAGYDKENFVVIETIVKELIKASNGNITAEDITYIGKGAYSKVYQIGDYVLKIGSGREYDKIPNHRRILQPIIRMKIKDDYENSFVEVQNVVDTKWYENMTEEEIDDILFEIYADMRDKGLYWTDISPENVGRLKRSNRSNYTFRDIDGQIKDIKPTETATGMIR